MKKARILWIFYRKLLFPTVVFSLLFSFIMLTFNRLIFEISFLLLLPLMHYLIYEIRLPKEYVFYANFGFSKRFLWLLTFAIALLVRILIAYF